MDMISLACHQDGKYFGGFWFSALSATQDEFFDQRISFTLVLLKSRNINFIISDQR